MRGGFDVPHYLGSRATFTLGNFGGHGGRALRDRRRAAHRHGACGIADPLAALPAALSPRLDA